MIFDHLKLKLESLHIKTSLHINHRVSDSPLAAPSRPKCGNVLRFKY